jgi:hypothetical protein
MLDCYKGTRFEGWIRVLVDPFDKLRGFSLKDREFRIMGYEPVQDVMEDMGGNRQPGKFWVVKAEEVYRIAPELKRFPIRMEPWFFPVEFCECFVRPYYYVGTPVKTLDLG